MIDIAKVILNFHKMLLSIEKGLSNIGYYKGGDEWDELSDQLYYYAVVKYVYQEYGFDIDRPFESWERVKYGVVVRVEDGSSMLIGKRSDQTEPIVKYEKLIGQEIEFSFVGFGNPSYPEEDVAGLGFVLGFSSNAEIICAAIDICSFFVKEP
ncbi:hypothetical protein [Saccharospirillum salsuginis]|uniref:Uncharacterized protein n=1 Tax=Saccharospirillum salsuginis TaxID=418750 RepID=A0A918KR70_9GAMM|nr:hypothetical protein [Saccharospirillum salsuginis]GGX72924.1 hypothetical protein GCM10007392_45360 [Saccharospirillum salsuginis]